MALLPIILGVGRTSAAGGSAFANPRRVKASKEKALLRDGYTCRCCGFTSKKYQRVVTGTSVGVTDDFVTLCRFCELCFFLEQAGLTGAGYLIWLPEMPQADLHHLMRAIYVAQAEENPLTATATRAFDALMARRSEAKKRLGSDDPMLLATVFLESLDDKEYATRAEKLEGLRFLPLNRWLVPGRQGDSNQFARVVKYWRSSEGPYGDFLPETWGPMLEDIVGKTATKH